MKKFLILVLLMPIVSEAMHHKSEPIIFYLDMEVADGKGDNVESFISYLSKTVKDTEPKTMYYKYWISPDKKKVSLIEVYQTNEAALFHMNAFDKAAHRDKFLETFVITNFQVLGNTNEELKAAMAFVTTDHRSLVDGFNRNKK